METYYNFIADQDTLVRFLNILPPLENDDVWMLILCARDKYLTDEEKKKYDLKDTSVVERKIIRESEIQRMMRVIKRFNVQIGSYTDVQNNPLPLKCFVLYFTINPKSVMKAVKDLIGRYLDYFFELSETTLFKTTIGAQRMLSTAQHHSLFIRFYHPAPTIVSTG